MNINGRHADFQLGFGLFAIASRNAYNTVHLPTCVHRIVCRRAGNMQLEVIEIVGNLGITSGKSVVQPDGQIWPSCRIVCGGHLSILRIGGHFRPTGRQLD